MLSQSITHFIVIIEIDHVSVLLQLDIIQKHFEFLKLLYHNSYGLYFGFLEGFLSWYTEA